MKLPNHENAFVPREKVIDYLLSFLHKDGRAKAEFFTRFGFSAENWQTFAAVVKLHAAEHKVSKSEASPFGMRYIIEGEIKTPDKRNPNVKIIWFIETNSDLPHLVTAYPKKKGK